MKIQNQDLRIKLSSTGEFNKALDCFIKLGYTSNLIPRTAQFIYTYSDGRMLFDYFDVEGADLSSSKSALGYFNASENKEITLDELLAVATHYEVWKGAPIEAFHWERFPNGKCVWHCHHKGATVNKKAPNFKIEQNALWRDTDKQKEADQINASINTQLSKLNIVLA